MKAENIMVMTTSVKGPCLLVYAVACMFAFVFMPRNVLAAEAQMDHSEHMGMHHATPENEFFGHDGKAKVDFELLNAAGELVRDEQFRGQYLLLTFGFTHCEHICPLMGATMGAVLRTLKQPAAGVFVSIDTERDTPVVTNTYAQAFNGKMQGLGGTYAMINSAADNFHISYVVTKTQNAYTVQHTANIFLIDPAGKLLETFPLDARVEEILALIH
ncbi:MAG: SCO family protein [Pseudomonadales bacterium]|nr:SCO family protein [Pseudomonadales bacterium]